MKTVGPNRDPVPTTSDRKVVASSPEEKSRILRMFLAVVLKSLKQRRALPGAEGQLSDWIFALHGFTKQGQRKVTQKDVASSNVELVDWLHHYFGAGINFHRIKEAMLQSENLRDNETAGLADSYRSGDRGRFNREFDRVVSSLSNQWGVPREFAEGMDFSSENIPKMLRAFQATLRCLVIYDVHPLNLIAQASRGDQKAVLELISVDKLFMCDSRTEPAIREAALQNNQKFIERIARAQNHEPTLNSRSAWHAYFFILFFAEYFGLSLPTLHELYRILDPNGRQYESLQSFERDFQRRRAVFGKILDALAEEFPLQANPKMPRAGT